MEPSETGVALVVVAAGSSRRFGSDKLAVRLGGRSVVEHAVAAARAAFPAAPVALVVAPEQCAVARVRWAPEGVTVVPGGARRQDSVRAGVEAVAGGDADVVAIHDGARPFVPAADVRAVVSAAREFGAAILVAPVVDTVKELGADGRVGRTVPRERLARALTPQAFRAGVLRTAWAVGGSGEWTDEAALVEAAGEGVVAVQGDPRNIKVTRPEDVELVAGLFHRGPRTGLGVDVHPFAAGRPLVLCGVEVPHDLGLEGHSDADVALHAVTDAILGACGGGDIGQHFPPSDERWRGAPSEVFVRHAVELAAARGWRVAHCDVTLLLEEPRIGPHRAAMVARLAAVLGLAAEAVNVKATTCEGLGFVGRREGVIAQAVVSLESR